MDKPAPDYIGRTVRFLPVGQCHGPQRVGIVIAQRPLPNTTTGNLPDTELQVRGKSGATVTISLVNNRASFT